MKEYIKTWTGADGVGRELRAWIDPEGDTMRGLPGDGKPRLCWEIKMVPPDDAEAITEILTALGVAEASTVASKAGGPVNSGSQGGSAPADTPEEIAQGVRRLIEQTRG